MTTGEIRATIRSALRTDAIDYFIDAHESGRQDVVIKSRELTFDQMAVLSAALHTRDINIGIDEGFGGSDVTPADGLTVTLYIKGIP